jgi:hypothetical protein
VSGIVREQGAGSGSGILSAAASPVDLLGRNADVGHCPPRLPLGNG